MADITTFLPIPPQHELLEFLSYDPETGLVTYTKGRWGGISAGSVTNGPNISFKGIKYKISRVIWMMVTGEDPVVIVDHHDGDHSNNRWLNLRLATAQQNSTNKKTYKNNLTGLKGVRVIRNKSGIVYLACIKADGRRYSLGRFSTPEEAALAYSAAAERLHGEFSITRRPIRDIDLTTDLRSLYDNLSVASD